MAGVFLCWPWGGGDREIGCFGTRTSRIFPKKLSRAVFRILILIRRMRRIRMFLGLPYQHPDPLVTVRIRIRVPSFSHKSLDYPCTLLKSFLANWWKGFNAVFCGCFSFSIRVFMSMAKGHNVILGLGSITYILKSHLSNWDLDYMIPCKRN